MKGAFFSAALLAALVFPACYSYFPEVNTNNYKTNDGWFFPAGTSAYDFYYCLSTDKSPDTWEILSPGYAKTAFTGGATCVFFIDCITVNIIEYYRGSASHVEITISFRKSDGNPVIGDTSVKFDFSGSVSVNNALPFDIYIIK